MMFRNRRSAGLALANKLMIHKKAQPVIVALPRGGVEVGFEVAHLLDAPLEIILVRKLGAPQQPDLALGAVANGADQEVVINNQILNEVKPTAHYLEEEIENKINEIKQMRNMYQKHRQQIPLKDRTVILVDDGIATGATMRVAIRRIKTENPQELIVATPVTSNEAYHQLKEKTHEVISLLIPNQLNSVSQYYEEFNQVTNEEVIDLLDKQRLNR